MGELLVRTDEPWRMMVGYFGMPEKTAEAWRNGWFHTGDGVVRDERGRYHFVDRIKDSMRRRGENISSMEVESYVNEHPAVSGDRCHRRAVRARRGRGQDLCRPARGPARSPMPSFTSSWPPGCPTFMLPRYIEFVAAPERTEAMKRIKKPPLRVDPLNGNTWDALAPAPSAK